MKNRIPGRHLSRMMCLAVLFCTCGGFRILGAESTVSSPTDGERLFKAHCARCHGMAGAGGTGPSLNRSNLRSGSNDESLAQIIKEGISGTGMPGNWMLSDPEVQQVLSHVRTLGQHSGPPLLGDAARGKRVYQEAQCATCHIIAGVGGSLGPELTRIGSRRGGEYLRRAVQHPGTEKPVDEDGFLSFLVVRATLPDGSEIQGMRVNEDSFTIQIRDAENGLHSLRKNDLTELRQQRGTSLMPSFEETLSNEQIEDLIAYLYSLQDE